MSGIAKFRPDQIHESVFIAAGAVVVGDVTIGADSSVWFNAVLRGDVGPIRIGRGTNIQDGCILHSETDVPCTLGDHVTVGHAAIVHGATVGNNVVVGMKAVVQNRAVIGDNTIVAVGAVVTEGTEVPPGSLMMGIPAKVKRPLTDAEIEHNREAAEHYADNAKEFAAAQNAGGKS